MDQGGKNVVGTWSGISNESKLYVNGVQIGTATSTVGSTLNVTDNNFVLGDMLVIQDMTMTVK